MFTIKCCTYYSFCGKFFSKTTFRKDTFFGEKEIGNHKSMKSSLVLFFLLVSTSIWGQDWCDPTKRPSSSQLKDGGSFTIKGTVAGSSSGCIPLAINVESSDSAPFYIFDYKGGPPNINSNTKSYLYTKIGRYVIMQLSQGSNGSLIKCQMIEAFAAPNFKIQTCSGRKVQVTVADDSTTKGYNSFIVNFGVGIKNDTLTKANPTTSYVYPSTTNTATVSVIGVTTGGTLLSNCKKDTTFILNSTNLSNISIRKVTTRPDGAVDILVKSSAGIKADVQIDEDATGTFKNTGQTATTTDTTTITIRNINTAQKQYCFRLSANDGCNNTSTTSNVVCATHLEVKAEDQQNVLNWKEYPQASNFQNYRINLNGAPRPFILNRTTTTQPDPNVTCGNQYCYQIIVSLAGGAESVSQLRCVKAISNVIPGKITSAVASVLEDEQKVEVRVNPPAVGSSPVKFKTIFTRADNGSNDYKEVAIVDNGISFIDPNTNPNTQSYCYKIQYENSCGKRSDPSEPVCSIHVYSRNASTIDWTPESPFLVPVRSYSLEIIDENGDPKAQFNLGGNTTFDPSASNPDQQLFKYRILAYPEGSAGTLSYSNYFVFVKGSLVFIPDAFSPNKDAINDLFAVRGQFIETSRLIVYNRWGQPIFESDDAIKKGWDGQLNGQIAPEGSYVYRVEIKDFLGKNFVKVGIFLLTR